MNPPGIEVLPPAKRSVTRPATAKKIPVHRTGIFLSDRLAEVALQQALESLAVAGLDIPRSEKYADFFCFKYV